MKNFNTQRLFVIALLGSLLGSFFGTMNVSSHLINPSQSAWTPTSFTYSTIGNTDGFSMSNESFSSIPAQYFNEMGYFDQFEVGSYEGVAYRGGYNIVEKTDFAYTYDRVHILEAANPSERTLYHTPNQNCSWDGTTTPTTIFHMFLNNASNWTWMIVAHTGDFLGGVRLQPTLGTFGLYNGVSHTWVDYPLGVVGISFHTRYLTLQLIVETPLSYRVNLTSIAAGFPSFSEVSYYPATPGEVSWWFDHEGVFELIGISADYLVAHNRGVTPYPDFEWTREFYTGNVRGIYQLPTSEHVAFDEVTPGTISVPTHVSLSEVNVSADITFGTTNNSITGGWTTPNPILPQPYSGSVRWGERHALLIQCEHNARIVSIATQLQHEGLWWGNITLYNVTYYDSNIQLDTPITEWELTSNTFEHTFSPILDLYYASTFMGIWAFVLTGDGIRFTTRSESGNLVDGGFAGRMFWDTPNGLIPSDFSIPLNLSVRTFTGSASFSATTIANATQNLSQSIFYPQYSHISYVAIVGEAAASSTDVYFWIYNATSGGLPDTAIGFVGVDTWGTTPAIRQMYPDILLTETANNRYFIVAETTGEFAWAYETPIGHSAAYVLPANTPSNAYFTHRVNLHTEFIDSVYGDEYYRNTQLGVDTPAYIEIRNVGTATWLESTFYATLPYSNQISIKIYNTSAEHTLDSVIYTSSSAQSNPNLFFYPYINLHEYDTWNATYYIEILGLFGLKASDSGVGDESLVWVNTGHDLVPTRFTCAVSHTFSHEPGTTSNFNPDHLIFFDNDLFMKFSGYGGWRWERIVLLFKSMGTTTASFYLHPTLANGSIGLEDGLIATKTFTGSSIINLDATFSYVLPPTFNNTYWIRCVADSGDPYSMNYKTTGGDVQAYKSVSGVLSPVDYNYYYQSRIEYDASSEIPYTYESVPYFRLDLPTNGATDSIRVDGLLYGDVECVFYNNSGGAPSDEIARSTYFSGGFIENFTIAVNLDATLHTSIVWFSVCAVSNDTNSSYLQFYYNPARFSTDFYDGDWHGVTPSYNANYSISPLITPMERWNVFNVELNATAFTGNTDGSGYVAFSDDFTGNATLDLVLTSDWECNITIFSALWDLERDLVASLYFNYSYAELDNPTPYRIGGNFTCEMLIDAGESLPMEYIGIEFPYPSSTFLTFFLSHPIESEDTYFWFGYFAPGLDGYWRINGTFTTEDIGFPISYRGLLEPFGVSFPYGFLTPRIESYHPILPTRFDVLLPTGYNAFWELPHTSTPNGTTQLVGYHGGQIPRFVDVNGVALVGNTLTAWEYEFPCFYESVNGESFRIGFNTTRNNTFYISMVDEFILRVNVSIVGLDTPNVSISFADFRTPTTANTDFLWNLDTCALGIDVNATRINIYDGFYFAEIENGTFNPGEALLVVPFREVSDVVWRVENQGTMIGGRGFSTEITDMDAVVLAPQRKELDAFGHLWYSLNTTLLFNIPFPHLGVLYNISSINLSIYSPLSGENYSQTFSSLTPPFTQPLNWTGGFNDVYMNQYQLTWDMGAVYWGEQRYVDDYAIELTLYVDVYSPDIEDPLPVEPEPDPIPSSPLASPLFDNMLLNMFVLLVVGCGVVVSILKWGYVTHVKAAISIGCGLFAFLGLVAVVPMYFTAIGVIGFGVMLAVELDARGLLPRSASVGNVGGVIDG